MNFFEFEPKLEMKQSGIKNKVPEKKLILQFAIQLTEYYIIYLIFQNPAVCRSMQKDQFPGE